MIITKSERRALLIALLQTEAPANVADRINNVVSKCPPDNDDAIIELAVELGRDKENNFNFTLHYDFDGDCNVMRWQSPLPRKDSFAIIEELKSTGENFRLQATFNEEGDLLDNPKLKFLRERKFLCN